MSNIQNWYVPSPGMQILGDIGETHAYDENFDRDFYLGERFGITCWVMVPDWSPYIIIPKRIYCD